MASGSGQADMSRIATDHQQPVSVADQPGLEDAANQPDVHTATDLYATRFDSRCGQYFLNNQVTRVLKLVEPWPGASVLEVGGGHAQNALALVDAGYDLTIHGSAPSCRDRPDRIVGAERYTFLEGNIHALPCAEQSYDVVLAVRMMAHVPDPVQFVGELCRVARHAVVVDFSAHDGLMRNATMASFRFKNWAEHNTTRRYNNHSRAEVKAMFSGFGLSPDAVYAQYMLPMVLHRRINRPIISYGLEAVGRVTGLTNRLGSPVLLRARRYNNVGCFRC